MCFHLLLFFGLAAGKHKTTVYGILDAARVEDDDLKRRIIIFTIRGMFNMNISICISGDKFFGPKDYYYYFFFYGQLLSSHETNKRKKIS